MRFGLIVKTVLLTAFLGYSATSRAAEEHPGVGRFTEGVLFHGRLAKRFGGQVPHRNGEIAWAVASCGLKKCAVRKSSARKTMASLLMGMGEHISLLTSLSHFGLVKPTDFHALEFVRAVNGTGPMTDDALVAHIREHQGLDLTLERIGTLTIGAGRVTSAFEKAKPQKVTVGDVFRFAEPDTTQIDEYHLEHGEAADGETTVFRKTWRIELPESQFIKIEMAAHEVYDRLSQGLIKGKQVSSIFDSAGVLIPDLALLGLAENPVVEHYAGEP